MSTECTSRAKEETIRGLVVDCQKAQAELRDRLDLHFNRNTEECVSYTDAPGRTNVLDEIMDSLKGLNESQKSTISFIINCINSKL